MKMFLPTTRDRFRLLEEIPVSMYNADMAQTSQTIPAGSIISFDKIQINKNTKLQTGLWVTLRIHSGNHAFTMKKYGGRAPYGFKFNLPLEKIRQLEVEVVENMP